MPNLSLEQLSALVRNLLSAAGTPDDIAERVADSLVESNRKGVDSHGVMNLPWYLEEIASGKIDPTGRPEVALDQPGAALLKGNHGFGIFALEQATQIAIEKAKAQGAAAVGLADCSHTGRIGRYAEMATAANCFGMVLGGGAHRIWANVVPHGGSEPVMSTNPYALGMPGGRFGPVIVDFATSTASDGKIGVHRAEERPVPEGWILDKLGQPTTDPNAFFDGGRHLPAAGHKGYGLGLIAELLGDSVLAHPPEFNWFAIVVDLAPFQAPEAYREAAESYLGMVKQVAPAPGFREVLLPGEPERRTAEARSRDGVPIPDMVWDQLRAAGTRLGVALEPAP